MTEVNKPQKAARTGRTKPRRHSLRRVTRLAAVQALYQLEISGGKPSEVLQEFMTYRLKDDMDGLTLGEVDPEFLNAVVQGVHKETQDMDDIISSVLNENWTVERLDSLLRIILRCGAWELSARPDVPARAVTNEYVEISHAFFEGREPGLVNGMLDRLARDLRVEEYDKPKD